MDKKITAFIESLISYDYVLFGSAFILFILFVVLSIVLRKKIALAAFFLLIGFSSLILLPTFGYIKMHEFLFKNTISGESHKKLSFTQAVVVKGTLNNESSFNFSTCKVSAAAYKVTKNKYKNYFLKLKPFQKMSIHTPEIAKNSSYDFKLFIEPFSYEKDYNISIKANCE